MSEAGVRIKLVEGAAVFYPGLYLNQLRGETLEQECQGLIARGITRFVINFSETELINSIGVSLLLGVIEAVNEARGSLFLSNLSAANRELFEVLGLMPHVSIAASEEEALARLSGRAVRPA